MKIIYSHLGFNSTDVFLVKKGRQLMCGTIFIDMFSGEYKFEPYGFFTAEYVKRHKYVDESEIPTSDVIIEEYKKQCAEKGVNINDEIKYAG